jgi:hypothetical protein
VENYWKKTIVLLIAVFFIAGLGIFLLSFPSARSVFVETIKHVAIPVVVDPNADIAEQKPLALIRQAPVIFSESSGEISDLAVLPERDLYGYVYEKHPTEPPKPQAPVTF